jgi:hypothetical protein
VPKGKENFTPIRYVCNQLAQELQNPFIFRMTVSSQVQPAACQKSSQSPNVEKRSPFEILYLACNIIFLLKSKFVSILYMIPTIVLSRMKLHIKKEGICLRL